MHLYGNVHNGGRHTIKIDNYEGEAGVRHHTDGTIEVAFPSTARTFKGEVEIDGSRYLLTDARKSSVMRGYVVLRGVPVIAV